jgi:hypothetical protein
VELRSWTTSRRQEPRRPPGYLLVSPGSGCRRPSQTRRHASTRPSPTRPRPTRVRDDPAAKLAESRTTPAQPNHVIYHSPRHTTMSAGSCWLAYRVAGLRQERRQSRLENATPYARLRVLPQREVRGDGEPQVTRVAFLHPEALPLRTANSPSRGGATAWHIVESSTTRLPPCSPAWPILQCEGELVLQQEL